MVGPWDASGVSWSHNYMCVGYVKLEEWIEIKKITPENLTNVQTKAKRPQKVQSICFGLLFDYLITIAIYIEKYEQFNSRHFAGLFSLQ